MLAAPLLRVLSFTSLPPAHLGVCNLEPCSLGLGRLRTQCRHLGIVPLLVGSRRLLHTGRRVVFVVVVVKSGTR
jgi:hypothetical protein